MAMDRSRCVWRGRPRPRKAYCSTVVKKSTGSYVSFVKHRHSSPSISWQPLARGARAPHTQKERARLISQPGSYLRRQRPTLPHKCGAGAPARVWRPRRISRDSQTSSDRGIYALCVGGQGHLRHIPANVAAPNRLLVLYTPQPWKEATSASTRQMRSSSGSLGEFFTI